MYLLWLALFASALVTQCVLQQTPDPDFSRPVRQAVSPEVYQRNIKQGFSTNYFKTVPAMEYQPQNIQDVYDKGFLNLRLRVRADLYCPPYDNDNILFQWFLNRLEEVVDRCLEVGVAPIISWIHHKAEAYATEEDRQNYIQWWTKVAEKLKRKDYRLSFNLFTELGTDECGNNCDESLRENTTKYNQWTSQVVTAIRATGRKNEQRILILTSPKKRYTGLGDIDQTIYRNDVYMMVEFHDYAAGPTNDSESRRFWTGNGTDTQRDTLKTALQNAANFALKIYYGAWMPQDNKLGSLNQAEVNNFARFYTNLLEEYNIPWSLNVLDVTTPLETAPGELEHRP